MREELDRAIEELRTAVAQATEVLTLTRALANGWRTGGWGEDMKR